MLKRQDSLLSSSSRRETPLAENRKSKSIGCISSLFQLLSKYQNRRKFITFGKKHEKKLSEESTTKTKKPLSVDKQITHKVAAINKKEGERKVCDIIINRRLSCEVPRSPTIPPEIRRSNSVNSPESFKAQSPTLVARLMGLEEMQLRTQKFEGSNSHLTSCGSVPKEMSTSPIRLASEKRRKLLTSCGSVPKEMNISPIRPELEKRRKLLGALEKCDDDLKMLKKVIETARSVEHHRSLTLVEDCAGSNNERWRSVEHHRLPTLVEDCAGFNNERWRSVTARSVEHHRSPTLVEDCAGFNNERWRSILMLDEFIQLPLASYSKKCTSGKRMPQQRQQKQMLMKKQGENDVIDLLLFEKFKAEACQRKCKSAASSTLWSSKAMIVTINEVCKDIDWGEKREIGRIGLVLQDYICKDLIEEIVLELGCFSIYSLPFEACKRRLYF